MLITRQLTIIVIVLSTGILTACSSIPKDGGISNVVDIIESRSNNTLSLPQINAEMPMSSTDIDTLLQEPLSLEIAERISVEANPMVKVMLAEVGVAEADYAQASRMENPGLSYERFSADDNSASLLFDIGGLVLIPLRRRMEAQRLESARYNAAISVLSHIAMTRKAWINAVAEKQQTALISRAVESAETSNNLTRQMTALGHSSVIEAAQSELLLGKIQSKLIQQRLIEGAAREALIRQLGLWGEQVRNLKLPNQLPTLPLQPIDIPAIERQAIEGRLDMKMATLSLEGMAKNLKLTRLNPFLSAIELGPVHENTEGENERGYEIELRLPIFDTGKIKTQKARIIFEQAQAQAESTAIAAASSAREALANYQSAWEIANHTKEIMMPLRQRISAEQLLKYNGMLISVFDLLNDLLSATTMETDYVNAMRSFWLADTNLQSVLTGSSSSEMSFSSNASMPASEGNEAH